MQLNDKVQHVYLVGAKSLGAYGGYETFVYFNSTNTLCIYKKRGYAGDNAKVISISNGAIADHKRIRKVGSPVRFGYLGPLTTHKGYNLFKNAYSIQTNIRKES